MSAPFRNLGSASFSDAPMSEVSVPCALHWDLQRWTLIKMLFLGALHDEFLLVLHFHLWGKICQTFEVRHSILVINGARATTAAGWKAIVRSRSCSGNSETRTDSI